MCSDFWSGIMLYREFKKLVLLHRHLMNQLDQKIGNEKKILRTYTNELRRKIDSEPLKDVYFRELRRETDQMRF